MADRRTIEVYDAQADEWIAERQATNADGAAWVERERVDGPLIDIGCGPGWHLIGLSSPKVALDASAAMLRRSIVASPEAAPVQASVDALPLRYESCGGAIASRVHLHLGTDEVPLALADLHRSLKPGAPVFLDVLSLDALRQANLDPGPGSAGFEHSATVRSDGRFGGRLFSAWSEARLRDVLDGAGFAVDGWQVRGSNFLLRLRRVATLADTVGPEMKMLVCGLNPSIWSADVGVGFGRPGNRFWPAALAAGVASVDRDPRHALQHHGLGMTDLVKRATRKAAELSKDEYTSGLDRLERLVDWLQPRVVCFVGLAGWRAVVERRAVAGLQDQRLGGRPVYLMPSTSGLNAHSQLPELTQHLRAAAAVR